MTVSADSSPRTLVGLDVSALDPKFKNHAHRGIGRYVSELRRYIERCTEPDVGVEFFNHESLVKGGLSNFVDIIPFGRTTLKQQLLYPVRLGRGEMRKFSFLHFPAHMDGPAWSTKPFVLTVLDLIPLVLEDLYRANRPSWRFKFARWLELQAIKRAVLILAISENTAQDIVRLLNVPRDRIVVTPLGVDASFFEVGKLREQQSSTRGEELRCKFGIPAGRPIMLYVGGHDERKNIRTLMEISRRSIDASTGAKPVLVLAGRISPELERERLNRAIAEFGMKNDLVELGYVPDDGLKALYAESALFLFPSLYEGFGLPVLEAMAAGLPVVSSHASSMPEIIGAAGLLFDPRNAEQAAAKVLRVLEDTETARALSQRGLEQARGFTWEETGRQTMNAYRSVPEVLARRLVNGSGPVVVEPPVLSRSDSAV
jgi:glycosyltransferase involved in cell wall biosynthesis